MWSKVLPITYEQMSRLKSLIEFSLKRKKSSNSISKPMNPEIKFFNDNTDNIGLLELLLVVQQELKPQTRMSPFAITRNNRSYAHPFYGRLVQELNDHQARRHVR